MAKKTISQALKDLFLGLGGDSSALADNTSASDYIQDLESAIKATASGASEDLIDDTEASSTKTYSSTKIESLIPANELPTPAVGKIGRVVSVVSDGNEGAKYDLVTPASVVTIPCEISGSTIILGTPAQTFSNICSLARKEYNYVRLCHSAEIYTIQPPISYMQYIDLINFYETGALGDSKTLVFAGIVYDAATSTYKRATAIFTDSKTGTYTETALT